jgi:hypothetical protein
MWVGAGKRNQHVKKITSLIVLIFFQYMLLISSGFPPNQERLLIYLWLYSPCGTLPLLQFLNLIHSR